MKEKIKNAYMLIYERIKKEHPEHATPIPAREILAKPTNQLIMQTLVRENKEYKIQNILFSQEYLKFVSSLLEDLQRHDPDTQSMVLKFTTTVYLTINLR